MFADEVKKLSPKVGDFLVFCKEDPNETARIIGEFIRDNYPGVRGIVIRPGEDVSCLLDEQLDKLGLMRKPDTPIII